jgi:hypothetical protein
MGVYLHGLQKTKVDDNRNSKGFLMFMEVRESPLYLTLTAETGVRVP